MHLGYLGARRPGGAQGEFEAPGCFGESFGETSLVDEALARADACSAFVGDPIAGSTLRRATGEVWR